MKMYIFLMQNNKDMHKKKKINNIFMYILLFFLGLVYFFITNEYHVRYQNLKNRKQENNNKSSKSISKHLPWSKYQFIEKIYNNSKNKSVDKKNKDLILSNQKIKKLNDLPTIVVGLMISKNVGINRINSFIESWRNPFSGFILKGVLVIGKGGHSYNQYFNNTVILDVHENIDEGKTYYWLKKAITLFEYDHPLNGIVKMDTDCAVNWTKFGLQIIPTLKSNYYIGRVNTYEICGQLDHCPPRECNTFEKDGCWVYMSGGWYALSLNLVNKITQCEYVAQNINGYEDLLIGKWIHHCSISAEIKLFHFENGDFFCHNSYILDKNIQYMSWTNLYCNK